MIPSLLPLLLEPNKRKFEQTRGHTYVNRTTAAVHMYNPHKRMYVCKYVQKNKTKRQ